VNGRPSESPRDRALSARGRRWLLLICLVALGLRLLATAVFEGLASPPNEGAMYDGVEYNAIASNVVRIGEFSVTPGHPTSFRAPGFPLALAGVYAVFGDRNYLAAHIFFCLVGAALCIATYLVAREMTDEPTALLAAGFVAVYPNLAYYAIHFASEPLFTLLLTLSVWVLLRAWRKGGWAGAVVAGLLLGLAALVRPAAFYFVPFFAIAFLARYRRLAPSVLSVAAMGIGVLLPIVPWAVRNCAVHHRYVLVASNGGSTFWGANNQLVLDTPELHGTWISTEQMPEEKKPVRALTNEVARDSAEWAIGKAFLRDHVTSVPRLVWYKFYAMWTPVSEPPKATFNRILDVSYGAALPFMVVGLVMVGRRRGWTDAAFLAVMAPIVATTAASVVFYGSARFRSTIEPLLLIFAAAAVIPLVTRVLNRAGGSRVEATSVGDSRIGVQ
jgi:4-amino-4-deoxy-L-arabinose transferase-like glycosyltransferase